MSAPLRVVQPVLVGSPLVHHAFYYEHDELCAFTTWSERPWEGESFFLVFFLGDYVFTLFTFRIRVMLGRSLGHSQGVSSKDLPFHLSLTRPP